MTTPTRYTLTLDDVRAHLLRVQITVDAPEDAAHLTLLLPAWTPGSYLLREYARFVQDVEAFTFDSAGVTHALPCAKLEKHRWRVDLRNTRPGQEIHVRYRVYGYDMSVRAVHIDDSHAFINGPAAFMLVEGRHDHPCHLTVDAHDPTWRIFTSLPRAEGTGTPVGFGAFTAPDYTTFVDCPIEIGPHAEYTFQAAGIEHRVVFQGDHRAPVARLLPDMTRVVEAAASLFGGLPYDTYLFIILGGESGRGGLEHASSTALQFPLRGYTGKTGHEDFLALVAHEHFHVWNVKRIRPEVLGPFDYTRENYTRALWAMEGVTCYYENLILRLAGLMTADRMLELLAERWGELLAIPGRLLQSVEASSFDAWIKLYRPDPANVNTTVSYYLKGELVACALDLHIRAETNGTHTFHDVMLALWSHWRETGAGFDEADLQRIFEGAVGLDLTDAFDRFVRGTDELPLPDLLRRFGLILATKALPDDAPPPVQLGVRPRYDGDTVILDHILTGSPAERAGLCPGDILVALDRARVSRDGLNTLLRTFSPGQSVEVHTFRRGTLTASTLTFDHALPAWTLTRDPDADPTALALRAGWLGPEA